MIDYAAQPGVKRVVARLETRRGSVGTGYLVAADRLVTCHHVIKDVQHGEPVGCAFGEIGVTCNAFLDSLDQSTDTGLLKLEKSISETPLELLVGEVPPVFWIHGFPYFTDKIPVSLEGRLADPDTLAPGGIRAFALFSPQFAARTPDSIGGFSGSPVLVGRRVIGHMSSVLGSRDARKAPNFGYGFAVRATGVQRLLDGSTRSAGLHVQAPNPQARALDILDVFDKIDHAADGDAIRQILERPGSLITTEAKLFAAERLTAVGAPREAMHLLVALPRSPRKVLLEAQATYLLGNQATAIARLRDLSDSGESPDMGTRAPRLWEARIEHPLQPAIHFQGRRTLLDDLEAWLDDPSSTTLVVSLIGHGGAGKTAIIEHLLTRERRTSLLGGLFVWSFYENNKTEIFLQRASQYFVRYALHADEYLQCLQQVLADGSPHLLILDGIELVQEDFGIARPYGSLKDPLLKLLLRSLAGGLGRARAIITSRFPLPDLRPWEGEGRRHWPISLESLDEDAAVSLLVAWGVRGERPELVELARQFGCHALSVAVLGAYIGEMCGGDPRAAAQFTLDLAESEDLLAAKLARVLAAYAGALSDEERQTLAVLSTLVRGVDVETLGVLMDRSQRQAAGVLDRGAPDGRTSAQIFRRLTSAGTIQKHLERLHRAGLVFSYRSLPRNDNRQARVVYTAHPFVRDYFRNLVDVEAINREAAALIMPSITHQPGARPSSPDQLDKFEQLIEHLAPLCHPLAA